MHFQGVRRGFFSHRRLDNLIDLCLSLGYQLLSVPIGWVQLLSLFQIRFARFIVRIEPVTKNPFHAIFGACPLQVSI